MKKMQRARAFVVTGLSIFAGMCVLGHGTVRAEAETEEVISSGIYVEGIDMSGMTRNQAVSTLESYAYRVLEENNLIHIQYDNVAEKTPSAGMLGGEWSNREIVDEMLDYGNHGNVVERYKSRKDLENHPVSYSLEFSFQESSIADYIQNNMTQYDQAKVNYSLNRNNGTFEVVSGKTGYEVNVEASAQRIAEALNMDWQRTRVDFPLVVEVTQPLGSAEELSQVKDLLGSYTTSFSGGTAEKIKNISNGAQLIDAVTLYPEEEFSFDAYAAPYTVAHGYAMGKAYSGGKLVDDVGGGICQVSSTLYNAVLRAELEVTMRYNHSMIVGYVPISSDATLAESAGKDFRFKNNQSTPIYVEAYVTKDHKLVTNIYGKETRPSNRTVEYVSETIEVIAPGADVITTNGSLPVGEIYVSSAYTGYKAKLWKVVKIDGKEQSRELVNTSNYRAVARMATVGTYTTDAAVLEQVNAAVATGNIDHVRNIVAAVTSAPSEPETVDNVEE